MSSAPSSGSMCEKPFLTASAWPLSGTLSQCLSLFAYFSMIPGLASLEAPSWTT